MMALRLLSLLFILKGLEEQASRDKAQRDLFSSPGPQGCRWLALKELARADSEHCYHHLRYTVGEWLASLDRGSCLDEAPYIFARPLPNHLYRLLDAVDALCAASVSLLEAFESVIWWAGLEGAFSVKAGQVLTPMHIAFLIAELVRPRPGERIMDMSSGTGNLLAAAWHHMQRMGAGAPCFLTDGRALVDAREQGDAGATLLGYDYSPEIVLPAYAHLLLCGGGLASVRCGDALGGRFNRQVTERAWGDIDVVLLNPPYNGFCDANDLGETLRWLETDKTELLFVELAMQVLREGGRAALLLPEGVYRNTSRAAIAVRKKLLAENQVHAVVALPQELFQPLAGIRTSLVLFTKGGHTSDPIWFYRLSNDGFSLDSRRRPVPETDLWDLRLQHAAAFGLAPTVPIPELIDQDVWEQYAAGYPATKHVSPVVEPSAINPISGERGRVLHGVTGLTITESSVPRSWYVSLEQVEAHGYSLCAETYQERAETRRLSRSKRTTRPY